MGNNSNPEQWAVMERLRFVERCAYWRGLVNRGDVSAVFGISAAQATSDLQRYQELNPGALLYSLNKKRYERPADMKCVLQVPRLEEALASFLGWQGGLLMQAGLVPPGQVPGDEGGSAVATVTLPLRQAGLAVQRAAFYAVIHGLRLRIKYASMAKGKLGQRWICPHAFGHDGYRWHLRAWCEENEGFRDFVLSRITEVLWPTEETSGPGAAADAEWQEVVELKVRCNPALDPGLQEAVKADYQLTNGKRTIPVRRAMLEYVRDHLRLESAHDTTQRWLAEEE